MFSDNEKNGIEDTKAAIKAVIDQRKLLWNGITRNVVIAGGFFTSWLQRDKFKDIDIFILNNDVDVYDSLTNGFHNATPKSQIQITEIGEWSRSEMVFYNHNPNIVDVINNKRTEAQYILTTYKTREELLNHFDYKHCKVSYVPVEDKLYINRETFDCIKKKILKVNNDSLTNGKNHRYRLNKFLNSGWVLETANKTPEYEPLKPLTIDQIKDSYQKLQEEVMANVLTGLPPMQQQTQTMADPYQAIIAQSVADLLGNAKR